MALSPERLRLTVAVGIFAMLGGAIFWVTRFPIQPRPPRAAVPGPARNYPTTVEGVVFTADGKPARADVSLVIEGTPQPMRGGPIRGRRAAVTRTGDDGSFEIGVSPGRYILVARSVATGTSADDTTDGASQWAAATVQSSSTVTKIKLTMRKGGGITGQVVLNSTGARVPIEALASAALSNTTVSIEPVDVDAKATLLDGAPRVSPRPDGHFVMSDVPPGRYRLSLAVPSPWIVDAIDSRGQDELDRPIKVEGGSVLNDMTVTAIDAPTVLRGDAKDANGHPLPFALVMAFAGDADARVAPRRTQATRADARGRFTFTGLPTGNYQVAIAPADALEGWYSQGFLANLARSASTVRLTAGLPGMALVTSGPK